MRNKKKNKQMHWRWLLLSETTLYHLTASSQFGSENEIDDSTVKLAYYIPSREMKRVRTKQSTFCPKCDVRHWESERNNRVYVLTHVCTNRVSLYT